MTRPQSCAQVRYTANDGGLLDVEHDMEELAKTPASEWKRLFDGRTARNKWPYGSGVWSKKEWVLPVRLGLKHRICVILVQNSDISLLFMQELNVCRIVLGDESLERSTVNLRPASWASGVRVAAQDLV